MINMQGEFGVARRGIDPWLKHNRLNNTKAYLGLCLLLFVAVRPGEAAEVGENSIDLGWLEGEHRHVGMARDDAFGQGLRQIFHRVALDDGSERGGFGMRAFTRGTDRVAARALLLEDRVTLGDKIIIGCKNGAAEAKRGSGANARSYKGGPRASARISHYLPRLLRPPPHYCA
jgi:hypothetical protein